jgi:hypothetical protein
VVVAGRENGEIVSCGDGSGIAWLAVAGGESVLGDSSFANIVASLSTD